MYLFYHQSGVLLDEWLFLVNEPDEESRILKNDELSVKKSRKIGPLIFVHNSYTVFYFFSSKISNLPKIKNLNSIPI